MSLQKHSAKKVGSNILETKAIMLDELRKVKEQSAVLCCIYKTKVLLCVVLVALILR